MRSNSSKDIHKNSLKDLLDLRKKINYEESKRISLQDSLYGSLISLYYISIKKFQYNFYYPIEN